MALSGQLSDLSLAELIEFFCNQRKSGRLKVSYPRSPGFFYFQKGALVDAKIGALCGVEAVYYALTLENASFKFSASFEPTRRTIHQPWAQVALEGLRRMDEGIAPNEAFPEGYDASAFMDDAEGAREIKTAEDDESENVLPLPLPKRERGKDSDSSAPLSLTVENASGGGRRLMVYGAVAAAVIISVAAVGFPAGWYGKKKADAPQPAAVKVEQQVTGDGGSNSSDQSPTPAADSSSTEQSAGPVNDSAALAAKREREARDRERWKAAQEKADAANPGATTGTSASTLADAAKKPEAAKPKSTTVQVTYDEAGRVTGASGGDANALRIARQKRFPAGKAGSATVTIPVN